MAALVTTARTPALTASGKCGQGAVRAQGIPKGARRSVGRGHNYHHLPTSGGNSVHEEKEGPQTLQVAGMHHAKAGKDAVIIS